MTAWPETLNEVTPPPPAPPPAPPPLPPSLFDEPEHAAIASNTAVETRRLFIGESSSNRGGAAGRGPGRRAAVGAGRGLRSRRRRRRRGAEVTANSERADEAARVVAAVADHSAGDAGVGVRRDHLAVGD